MTKGGHRKSWWELSGYGCCGRCERKEIISCRLVELACDNWLAAHEKLTLRDFRKRNDWRKR